jgi:hypothetical protein
MKLTIGQLDWLKHARMRGYERPFTCMPLQPLRSLEKLGLLESNPCGGKGALTEWRITQAGLNLKLDDTSK